MAKQSVRAGQCGPRLGASEPGPGLGRNLPSWANFLRLSNPYVIETLSMRRFECAGSHLTPSVIV